MISSIFSYLFEHPLILVFIVAGIVVAKTGGKISDRNKDQKRDDDWVKYGMKNKKNNETGA